MRAGESQSDVEAELESEDPTEMGDDVISSKEEGGWDAGVTSAARREPTATPASGGQDMERCDGMPRARMLLVSGRRSGRDCRAL